MPARARRGRRNFERELAMALLETVDELESALGILERLAALELEPFDAAAIERTLAAGRDLEAQANRRRLLRGYAHGHA